MRIFCTRIIREKKYRELLKFKNEVEEILIRNLPMVRGATLKNKNITLSRGCVLINSQIFDSKIDYKSKTAIEAFYNVIMTSCVFIKKKK